MGKKGGAPQTSMNHRNYDLVPVSSDTVRDIYAEAFGISPSKVQALGVPRTDRLLTGNTKKKSAGNFMRSTRHLRTIVSFVCADIPRRWE